VINLYPEALGLYGTWLAESKSENPNTIIEKYLEKVSRKPVELCVSKLHSTISGLTRQRFSAGRNFLGFVTRTLVDLGTFLIVRQRVTSLKLSFLGFSRPLV